MCEVKEQSWAMFRWISVGARESKQSAQNSSTTLMNPCSHIRHFCLCAQTPFWPLSPLDSVALVCPTNRWHYLWRQYYENILGEIVFSNLVSLKHLTRILPLMTAKLSKIGNFSPSCPTSKRDQIPLSNIFSASTSNAISWTKKVIENNSAIQPH